jgi:eukaryotic-like serine/threonine-protein kinase
MDSPLPPRIGRYRVRREVGRGAMGMVYQAEDPDIGRAVAIKLVRADLLQGRDRDEFLTRFRHEARAAGRCTHPNIVALYDLAQHEGNPFLAMEYVNGIDLAQALRKRGRFTPAEAVATMTQVLDALAAAHAAGIVHRDVKPANILLQSNGQVKVTDFGISHLSTSDLTQQGAVLGTLTYMSPEQCCGQDIDLRSDLFSVGTVLYELLSGSRAFQGRNANEVAHKLLTAEPPDLATLVAGLPQELVRVVRKSMEKSRDSRYPSAQAMADALRSPVREAAATNSPPSEAKTVARMQRLVVAPVATAQVDDATLKRIERSLAFHIGPIARHVLREAARNANSIEALCEAVSLHIGPADERERFLTESLPGERRRTDTAPVPPIVHAPIPPGGGGASAETITAEQIDRAERALASVLGPIAKMMVRRALPGVESEAALWERLASSIEDASDRGEFLGHKARRPPGRTGR